MAVSPRDSEPDAITPGTVAPATGCRRLPLVGFSWCPHPPGPTGGNITPEVLSAQERSQGVPL